MPFLKATTKDAIEWYEAEIKSTDNKIIDFEKVFGTKAYGLRRRKNILSMALTALREQEERSKGCEYCDGNQRCFPVADNNYYSFDSIGFEADGKPYLNDADGCDIWIKFCPMCGRKLEVEG